MLKPLTSSNAKINAWLVVQQRKILSKEKLNWEDNRKKQSAEIVTTILAFHTGYQTLQTGYPHFKAHSLSTQRTMIRNQMRKTWREMTPLTLWTTIHSQPQQKGQLWNIRWPTDMFVGSREPTGSVNIRDFPRFRKMMSRKISWNLFSLNSLGAVVLLEVKTLPPESGAGKWHWSTPWINISVEGHSLERNGFWLLLIASQSKETGMSTRNLIRNKFLLNFLLPSIVRAGDAIYVRVGDHDLTQKFGSPGDYFIFDLTTLRIEKKKFHIHKLLILGAQTLRVATTYIHHNHNSQTLDNDIAILKLHGEADLKEGVCLVCLPARGTSQHAGKRCTVTGYGYMGECKLRESWVIER